MGAFRPEDHFRNLKGKQYLEVVWRIVWFHEEREKQAGSIRCQEIMHEPTAGIATFHAVASYWMDRGDGTWVERVGHGNGSETRKDFGDYYEKAATKAIGRALANLGYGTQFAIELDEGLESPGGTPAESPVTRRQTDDKSYMQARDAEDREAARASAQAQRTQTATDTTVVTRRTATPAPAPMTAEAWMDATLKAKEKLAGKTPPYPAVMADWLRVHIGRGQELVPGILRTDPALMTDEALAFNLDTLEQAIVRKQAAATKQQAVPA